MKSIVRLIFQVAFNVCEHGVIYQDGQHRVSSRPHSLHQLFCCVASSNSNRFEPCRDFVVDPHSAEGVVCYKDCVICCEAVKIICIIQLLFHLVIRAVLIIHENIDPVTEIAFPNLLLKSKYEIWKLC